VNQKIYVFTVAGGRCLDLYNRYTLQSLSADIKALRAIGYEVEPVLFDSHQEVVRDVSSVILPPLREMIAKCVSENAMMFLAPPDTVFSRGTMVASVVAVKNKPYSLAIPHVRVTDGPPVLPISPCDLMRWAFDHGHKSFTTAYDCDTLNCTWSGIAMRKITDTGYVMQHSLPTLYMVQFTGSDIDFWNACPEWMQWDRSFLMKLWNEGRVIVAGSSDMASCVEITSPESNVPGVRPAQYSDKYFAEAVHNKALKSFCYYMRLSTEYGGGNG